MIVPASLFNKMPGFYRPMDYTKLIARANSRGRDDGQEDGMTSH
jgi:hypothetical protein